MQVINSNTREVFLQLDPPPPPPFASGPHPSTPLMNIDNPPPAVLNGNAVKNDAGCATRT